MNIDTIKRVAAEVMDEQYLYLRQNFMNEMQVITSHLNGGDVHDYINHANKRTVKFIREAFFDLPVAFLYNTFILFDGCDIPSSVSIYHDGIKIDEIPFMYSWEGK